MTPVITLIIVIISYYLLDLGVCAAMNMNYEKKKKKEKKRND